MKVSFLKISLVLILLSFSFNFTYSASKPSELTYDEFYKEFTTLQPDESKVCDVSNLFLQRDAGVFSFEEGKLYFFKPLAGRICMAVFIGKGNFAFTPPTKVEKEQLERFYKTQMFDAEFESLFLVFTDSTYKQITESYPRQTAVVPSSVTTVAKDAINYVLYGKTHDIQPPIAQALLEDKDNGLFYTHINRKSGKPVMWLIDPTDIEEVSFLHGLSNPVFSYFEGINQFHYQEHYTSKTAPELENEYNQNIRIEKYIIDATIENNLYMKCKTDVFFKANNEGDRWCIMSLDGKMTIDSILSSNGINLHFHKGKESGSVYIKLANAMKRDSIYSIRICYEGQVINRIVNWTFLEPHVVWYPTLGMKDKAIFDITFHYPDNYVFSCSGDSLSKQKNGKIITERYATEKPVIHMAFNIGDFRVKEVREPDVPPITIFSINTEQVDWVATDLVQSIKFYSNLYGKIPVKHFYISEIPYGYGQAFPNFLHLSSGAFRSEESYGYHEMFVSHEMGHQWWLLSVDYKTYHDSWISEGLTEYSCMMYMQLVLKDNSKFFEMLKRDKKEILESRGLFSKGIEKGPISLGHRNQTSMTEGDYSLIIYKKGAWVMHMLRNLLIDLKTMNEDKYLGLMKDFYTAYANKTVSTRELREYIQKFIGQDMTWFFDQWVDGTGIPTYKYAYKYDKQPDGKYKVKLRVKQENVPANFLMYVPVKIDFGDEKFARLRVKVTGEKSEIDLPTMPLEPKEIIFNDLESVLCEVESEKWE